MVRAEREGFIKLSVLPDESAAVEQLERIFIKRNPSPVRPLVEAAVRDGYKRLLKPSMEGETLTEAKARARRGVDKGVRREPAAVVARRSARTKTRVGDRSRIPHRLQGGMS